MSGSMNEQEKREFLKANPEILARAGELYDMLAASIKEQKRFKNMSNAELADELQNGPWAVTPIFTEFSDLMDEIMDRLRGDA